MKSRRRLIGSEAVEVAVTSLILLGLAIGAVTIFGGQIQKVFQGDVSPMMVSAKMGKSSITQSGSIQETARTNIDPHLATNTGLNTIASAVGDKTQSVGMETTGTAGDTGIKGTYLLDPGGLAATNDGNSETTGNLLLDNALLAKKMALALFDQASATIAEAEVFNQIAASLQDSANYQSQYVSELSNTVTSISEELKRVVDQMALLNMLAVATGSITADVGSLVTDIADINASIQAEVTANMQNYDDINALNATYDTAYQAYLDLKAEYNTGTFIQDPADLVNVCADPVNGGAGCKWASTTGITLVQVQAAEAQATQIQSNVDGKLEELKQKLEDTLEPAAANLSDKADDAYDKSQNLLEQAKKTLKDAFHHSNTYFSGCVSVTDYIDKANYIINNKSWDVENTEYAKKAIELLTNSQKAYLEAKELQAKADAAQTSVDNTKAMIASLEGTAATLQLQSTTISDAIMSQDEQQVITLITQCATNQITDLAQLKIILTDAHTDALSYASQQQSYLTSILEQAAQAQQDAADVISEGQELQIDATNAMKEAQNAINEIVTPST